MLSIMALNKISRNVLLVSNCTRFYSLPVKENKDIIPNLFTNRNPRNLEKIRIGYKPSGYHVDKPGKCFWHKIKLSQSQRHVTATVHHFQNGEVISASTKEWAIKKQLNKTTDTKAYYNIGRVLAQRCLECGLVEICCDYNPENKEGKVAQFLKGVEESGITLSESPQYQASRPWDLDRPEKPWDIREEDLTQK